MHTALSGTAAFKFFVVTFTTWVGQRGEQRLGGLITLGVKRQAVFDGVLIATNGSDSANIMHRLGVLLTKVLIVRIDGGQQIVLSLSHVPAEFLARGVLDLFGEILVHEFSEFLAILVVLARGHGVFIDLIDHTQRRGKFRGV